MGSGDGGRLCCRLGARDDCFPKAAGARFRGLFVEVPDARSRLTSRWTADPESGGVVFRFLTGGGLESGEEPGETEEDGCGGRGLDAGLGCCGVGLRAIRVVTMTGLDVDATALETFEEEKKPRSEEEGRAAGDVSILWEEDEVNNAFKSFAHRSRFYGGCVLMPSSPRSPSSRFQTVSCSVFSCSIRYENNRSLRRSLTNHMWLLYTAVLLDIRRLSRTSIQSKREQRSSRITIHREM